VRANAAGLLCNAALEPTVRAVLRGDDDGAVAVALGVALLGHSLPLVAEHGANLLTNLCGAPS